MHIVGHKENRERLNNIIKSGKIGHAYLFVGKAGIGKKLVAVEFAKSILCLKNENGQACGNCEACKTFENNADFFIIEPEKNIIKVDVIREFEKEVYLKPTISNRKCFIINDADLMNESAQNALLKILEEPPEYATIILLATKKEKLLNTIKSRVVTLNFNGLTDGEMREVLGDKANDDIIKFSRGSVRDALQMLDENYIDVASSLVKSFKTKDFLTINRKINDIKSDKDLKSNISSVLGAVILICYKELRNDAIRNMQIINIVDETNRDIMRNANFDLALDNMVVRLCF